MTTLLLLGLLVFITVTFHRSFAALLRFWVLGEIDEEDDVHPAVLAIGLKSWGAIAAFLLYNLLGSPEVTQEVDNMITLSKEGIMLITVAVVLEEIVFRGLPLLISQAVYSVTTLDPSQLLGFVASLVFGYLHLENFTDQRWHYVASQTFGGFVLFYIAKRYGFGHAIIVHLLFNALILVLTSI